MWLSMSNHFYAYHFWRHYWSCDLLTVSCCILRKWLQCLLSSFGPRFLDTLWNVKFLCYIKQYTVKPVFKTTWEIGTTCELRTATSVPRSFQHIEMDLRNKTTSEFRTVLDCPLAVPNSQVPLYTKLYTRIH